jgi:DNA-binding NtrC family response regulator
MSSPLLIAVPDDRLRNALVGACEALGRRALEARGSDGLAALAAQAVPVPEIALVAGELPADLRRQVPGLSLIQVLEEGADAALALRRGADDVLVLPLDPGALEAALVRIERGRDLARDRATLRRELGGPGSGPLDGGSRTARRLAEQVQRIASTPRTTVLVTGELGVGKARVVRAIHEASAQAAGPLVTVACAGRTPSELAAELLGLASMGQADPRGGRPEASEAAFLAARGGTLHLEEVGELPEALQERLHEVLRDRTLIGPDGEERLIEARIVATSRRDLAAEVEAGRLREDLFYRLNVLSLEVPPLRERVEDLPALAAGLLSGLARELGQPARDLAPEALAALHAHPWPGNLRELRNCLERGLLHASGPQVGAADLGLVPGAGVPGPAGEVRLELPDCRIEHAEEALIREALRRAEGNRSATARLLGVNRTTLYNKLKGYRIEG